MTKVNVVAETTKIPRSELLALLSARDGDRCQHPDCDRKLDFGLIGADSPLEPTIDHWMPQSWCYENGWTYEQVWALSNLRLMHKKCNAKKGSLVPNSDGTLPEREKKEFKRRAEKRANRAEVCESCQSGRMLDLDEICPVCGGGPNMPYPTLYKVHPSECPHEGPWSCWSCMLEMDIRTPAIVDVLDGGIMEE